ncbi:VOC family protein [Dongia sp.]|uniref:VOC family protein n=1 Tax=Dongia sp. TaxID=1977262 RepID=UPI003753C940
MKFDHAAEAITGIDHTLVGVRDLEAARGVWETLGFTCTPRGRHIGWGTGNYCIMLESGYIELLGVVDPSQFLNNLDVFLKKREGLMGLAFGTDNPRQCAEALKDSGVVFEGPKGLKRKLELPEGEVLPEFELLYLDREATPSLNAFVTHHLTPELIRRPEWLRHANRARRLISVTIVTEDPVRTVIGYLPLFGPDRIQVSDAMTVVDTGAGALRFVTPKSLKTLYDALLPLPEHATPWVAAMKIEVADKARCRDFLKDRHVPVEKTGKGCLVPPEVANGCIIEFVQL